MRNRIIIILIVLFILPATLFAGTLFEEEKKTSDPFVGERGGFNSLFVNPAGAAGQSGFELSLNVGGRSKMNDINLIMGVADMASSISSVEGIGRHCGAGAVQYSAYPPPVTRAMTSSPMARSVTPSPRTISVKKDRELFCITRIHPSK